MVLSSPTKHKHPKILEMAKTLNMLIDVSVKNASVSQTSVSSPFTLPPYDSLPPVPLPDTNYNPPICIYPPPNRQSPPTTIPSPIGLTPSPTIPSPSIIFPGPPYYVPNPPPYYDYEPSPPSSIIPSPPQSPIGFEPSPPVFEPSPPVFEPPVVYPPPTGSSSPYGSGGHGHGRVWCVAKPSVPNPIIQEAMNYACGSGADCGPIQPNGSCFVPNTLLSHASYAFNSYWQRTKVAGATCSFGGTAMLVTVDPSQSPPITFSFYFCALFYWLRRNFIVVDFQTNHYNS